MKNPDFSNIEKKVEYHVDCRISKKAHKKLLKLVKKYNTTKSKVIRKILEAYLE